MSMWDDLVAAAAGPHAALHAWDEKVTENTDWRFESWAVVDGSGLPVDLSGCTATVQIFDKPSGKLIQSLTASATSTGQVIATASKSMTEGLAGRFQHGRDCSWECRLKLPDGREAWLWSASGSTLTIKQEGASA